MTVELVPSTCWFSNVRSEVSRTDWDTLKRLTSKAARYRCEVCGGRGSKWPVECHEVWTYRTGVQQLVRLIALCPDCHEVKHLGLAESRGRLQRALQHLATINGWAIIDARRYAEAVFELWAQRSNHEWSLDLSYLDRLNMRTSGQAGKASPCKGDHPGFDSPLVLHLPKAPAA